jgi:type II secretion system-associated lipoprotein
MQRVRLYLFLALGCGGAFLHCGGKFVRKDDVQRISKDYEQVFALKKKIDIGNFDSLNQGAKVKIFFKTAGDYVSVYAYPYSQPREEAVGKNILQMFESDFPNKIFSEQVFRDKLATLIEPYNGRLDPPKSGSPYRR